MDQEEQHSRRILPLLFLSSSFPSPARVLTVGGNRDFYGLLLVLFLCPLTATNPLALAEFADLALDQLSTDKSDWV